MKKLIILSALIVSLAGCAWFTKQVDYQTECLKDPVCLQDAKVKAELVKTVVGIAYPSAAGAAGAAVLTFLLWYGGKRKEEKK